MIDEVALISPGDMVRGRHRWAIRSMLRVAELVEAGCLTSQSIGVMEANFLATKPGAEAEWQSVVRYAVANATARTKCDVHRG
jgi:hypothetical protein